MHVLKYLLDWIFAGEVSAVYLGRAPKLFAVEVFITIEHIAASQLATEIRLEDASHYAELLVGFPFVCHLRLCIECWKP